MAVQSGHLTAFGIPAWIAVTVALVVIHIIGTTVLRSRVFAGHPLAKDPVLAGHFLPQLIGFVVFAVYGGIVWLGSPIPDSPVGAYFFPGEVQACLMAGFQSYELAATVPSKRLRGPAHTLVAHHVITLLLAVLAYNYQAYHHFGAFFFGISEISSVPLAFVDLFKQFPALKSAYPVTNEAARTLFAVSFLVIRGLYWPYVSFFFWESSLAALLAQSYEPRAVIYTFCAANVAMTLLQWYWAFLIIFALIKMAKGAPKDEDEDEDEEGAAEACYKLQQDRAGV